MINPKNDSVKVKIYNKEKKTDYQMGKDVEINEINQDNEESFEKENLGFKWIRS